MLLIIGARIAFDLPAMSLGRLYVPDNPYVPITLQTFGVLFTSALLGARRGVSATGIYLLIGAIGMPVFAFERSGMETFFAVESGRVVLGATGGYLVGFLLASAVVGSLAQRGWDRRIGGSLGAMLLGTLIIYAVGLVWLTLALGSSVVDVLPFGLKVEPVLELDEPGSAATRLAQSPTGELWLLTSFLDPGAGILPARAMQTPVTHKASGLFAHWFAADRAGPVVA